MSDKQTVAVQIAGRDYKIRTDSDEASLHRIAGYVDRAMQRIRVATSTIDTQDVAMLTCLNLARQLLSLHEEHTANLTANGSDKAAGSVGAESAIAEARMRELIERVEEVGAARSATLSPSDATPNTSAGAPNESSVRSGARSGEAAETSAPAPAPASTPAAEREPARTLELPSPEVLRERSANAAALAEEADSAEGSIDATQPEAKRAAGGGRDLAS